MDVMRLFANINIRLCGSTGLELCDEPLTLFFLNIQMVTLQAMLNIPLSVLMDAVSLH